MRTHYKTKIFLERRREREKTQGTPGAKESHRASVAPAPARPEDKRILVVDDDPGVRESLMAVLREEGYIALPAGGGSQALALASSMPPDLVLLDLNLMGQNGWDIFERLTSEHPTVPIIIITARSDQLFTAVATGAGALLEKPLDIPMLLQTIARLLTAPPEAHLARLAGRKAEFFYSAGQGSVPGPPGDTGKPETSND